ncbi:MAG: SDR family oxidoreductase, partial [Pseudomonadota bacterium]|nr:SDR family oxidoreductase [Pseudomonadota bacterium]
DTSEQAGRIGVPLGRTGLPAEVAAAVALLCSDQGGFISGQMIAVNGGAET